MMDAHQLDLDALIIDPNPISRSYLWQALLADVHFQSVKAYSKPPDALFALANGYAFHVILVSSIFTREEIASFVQGAKVSEGGKEAAYICVLKVANQDSESIAEGLISGTDGFLLEPYSVNSLRQVSLIAGRIRGEFEQKRKIGAYSILIQSAMKALDHYAFERFTEGEVNVAKKLFLKSTTPIQRIAPENLAIYHEVALKQFETAQPRPAVGYKGASKRVKERAAKQTQRMERPSTGIDAEGGAEPSGEAGINSRSESSSD